MKEKSSTNHPSKTYLKGVNGLRSLFLIPVLLSHTIHSLGDFGLDPFILGETAEGGHVVLDIGLYGVAIFFGISGFLITYLLRIERDRFKKINIKKFYIRRALRLFPLYYIQLIFCLVLYSIFEIEYTTWSLLMYVFYAVNIPFLFGGVLPFLNHYWTLAVEEQFYLFWPWFNKLSNRQLLRFSWSLLILFLLVRAALAALYPQFILLKLMNHAWFQCILIGVIFCLYYLDHHDKLMQIAASKWTQLVCWTLFLFGSFNLLKENIVFEIELTTIAGCLIMVGQNSNNALINLETKLFNFIGRLTYGIYIVHYSMIFLASELIAWELIDNKPLRYILVVLTIFSSSILLAHLSYKFIESPFLRIKEKRFTYVHGMKS